MSVQPIPPQAALTFVPESPDHAPAVEARGGYLRVDHRAIRALEAPHGDRRSVAHDRPGLRRMVLEVAPVGKAEAVEASLSKRRRRSSLPVNLAGNILRAAGRRKSVSCAR